MRQNSSTSSGRQNIGFVLILGAFVVVIISLSRNLVNLLQAEERVISAEQQLQQIKTKNQALEQQAQEVTSGKLDEQYIRDQLAHIKPEETLVLIPDELLQTPTVVELSGELNEAMDNEQIWKKWLQLFF